MEKHFVIAAKSDVGNVKTVNQDSLYAKVLKTSKGEIAFSVICDGMGGLTHGEMASSFVVKSFQRWFDEFLILWLNSGQSKKQLFQEWDQLIKECNKKLILHGKRENYKCGTTATVMLFVKNKYFIGHIGDCRVYELRNGIKQLTKDHTLVAREVALGHLTPKQAETDRRNNILLQCIGVYENIKPEYIHGKIKNNSSFLVCSDGFRHCISEIEIQQYLTIQLKKEKEIVREDLYQEMSKRIETLISLNKNRGEKDNISAILIRAI